MVVKGASDSEEVARGSETTIRSVSRAARLLLAAARRRGLSAAEGGELLGVPQPTAYHLLNTLRLEGLLSKEGVRFVLGPQIGVLADAWVQSDTPPSFLLGALRHLAAETGETAYLAAWREGGIRALASVGGVRAVRVATTANGPYLSPHARATGKLLLAFADEARREAVLGTASLEPVTPRTITDRAELARHFEAIRATGYAEDHEEFMEGVSCIAAPVLLEGTLVAALTVSAPTQRFASHREELRDAVLRAARAAGGESPTPSLEVE